MSRNHVGAVWGMRGLAAGLLLTAAGFAGSARDLAGQSTSAQSTVLRPLEFGVVIPGAKETVTVEDAHRRAAIVLEGAGRYEVRFVLPEHLLSGSDARLTLRFDAFSAGIAPSEGAKPATFDPRLGTVVTHRGQRGSSWIYLGATADPAPDLPAGQYHGHVVVLIGSVDS